MEPRRVLNPALYQRVCRFAGGADRVRVAHAGQRTDWQRVKTRVAARVQHTRRVLESGEEYIINCPYCGDQRGRLMINHNFGTLDPDTQQPMIWLAQCWNETRCLDEPQRQREFYHTLLGTFGSSRVRMPTVSEREADDEYHDPEPPGKIVTLSRLAKVKYEHAALAYLRSRGYDPVALSRLYNIGFCYECRDRYANNRIYIPITEDGVLCGWQARYVGDDVDGVPFSKAHVPKYYTMPGYRKTAHVYNFEQALEYPTCVLVEGAIDVWGFGRQSVATFGCKLSHTQAELIVKAWRKRHKKRARFVVLYDPAREGAVRTAGGRRQPHQIERARARLMDYTDAEAVLPVYLPGGDPGSLDPVLQRNAIERAAHEAGISEIRLLDPDPVRL